ncbi:MAG: hemerythrin domain-containing protein [Acidobacteriia bacterium]|nr:hemerythrin domain-containing protein [Terriglobia bacterium]
MIPVDQLFQQRGGASGTLESPLDHLVACHRRIEARLAALERVAAQWNSDPRGALDTAASCFRFLDTSGALHTRDEEESIFPRLRPWINQFELCFLDKLEHEHADADQTYLELKSAVQARDGARYRPLVNKLCEMYRSHIASEDALLIEMGKRVLTPPELAGISAEMKLRRGL